MHRDAFCAYCGTAHTSQGYPKTCPNPACARKLWANPIPVSVLLVPVLHEGKKGLLVIRRGIEPAKGRLALAGGFLEEHETFQQGGAREIFEETGIQVDPASVQPFWFSSTEPKPNRVLLFSTCEAIQTAEIPSHEATAETQERGVIFGAEGLEEVFAFSLHTKAVQRYFAEHNITGPHNFTPF